MCLCVCVTNNAIMFILLHVVDILGQRKRVQLPRYIGEEEEGATTKYTPHALWMLGNETPVILLGSVTDVQVEKQHYQL